MNKREAELKHRQTMAEGERAKKLLNDPLIIDFFKNEKDMIIEKLASAEIDEDRERELTMYLKAVFRFERIFKKKIRNGNKAQTLLDRLLKR